MALPLAMIGVGMAMTLGLGFLASQATSTAMTRNVVNRKAARSIAESGLTLAITYVRSNSGWRTAQTHGAWLAPHAFGGGTFRLQFEDPGDANLSNNSADPVTLTSVGTIDGASFRVSATVTPGSQGCSSGGPVSITGATRYVRTSGSDANNGMTPATAWRTIDFAAMMVSFGDGVYVGAGTYNEVVQSAAHGTASDPIWFIADTLGTQTGDAGAVVIDGGGQPAFQVSHDNIRIVGFRLTGRYGAEWLNCFGGVLRECELDGSADQGVRVDLAELEVQNCLIHDNGINGIYVTDLSTITVTDTRIWGNAHHGINRWDGSACSITVTRCDLYNNGRSGLHLSMRSGGTCALTNCLIYGNGRQGVNQTGNDGSTVTIWHCTIATNGERGIFLQSNSTSIVRNSIVVWNQRGLHVNGGSMTHDHNIVFGNTVADYQGTSAGLAEINSNPLFVGALFIGGGDYHLATGSPAIDSGTNASAVTTLDCDCGGRPAGAGWDIGYDEVGSAAQGFSLIWNEQP